MTEELKPCPFCGGVNSIIRGAWNDYKQMVCANCGAEGPVVNMVEGMTNSESVKAIDESWNSRTPEPNTEIIRWITYDGTQETLPNHGKKCLVDRADWCKDAIFIGTYVSFSNSWLRQDSFVEFEVKVRDEWAYLQK